MVHGHVPWNVFGDMVELNGSLEAGAVIDSDVSRQVAGKTSNGSGAFSPGAARVVSTEGDGELGPVVAESDVA